MSYLIRESEGQAAQQVLPYSTLNQRRIEDLQREIRVHLDAGGTIHLQYTDGARKGTRGRLEVTSQDFYGLYPTGQRNSTQRTYMNYHEKSWNLVFDDRKNKIALELHALPGIILFQETTTQWSYETKAREKLPDAILYDHFGVQLAIGQLVLVPQGTKGFIRTRFAYIKGITPAGTIRVESIKTRAGHEKEESNVSPTIESTDLVVLDGDATIKDKVLMARLTS